MTATTEIALKPGELLYHEGDSNHCGYIIESGEIILYTGIDGNRENVEIRGPGSIVGELSILTGQPRKVSVEALTECRVFEISADQILARLEKVDPILRACIETSINFTSQFHNAEKDGEIPFAPSTLRNADQIIKNFRFEKDIIKGLDNNEFRMVYQPIVRLGTGDILGFESLARWQHPTIGNVRPDQFIEVAEQMGSISKITDFAILETCKALQDFCNTSYVDKGFFASVNISGHDLGRREFVDFLSHAMDLYDLHPRRLSLEITERAVIPDTDISRKNLRHLRKFGYGLSIDDFGTGYSNLAYLKQLPLTAIKIDRSFAGETNNDVISKNIVKTLIRLGKDLGVKVIAEGLETQSDVEALTNLGCNLAQGYHFSRPIEKREFMDLIHPSRSSQKNVA